MDPWRFLARVQRWIRRVAAIVSRHRWGRVLAAASSELMHRWRRSLQLRVVTSTMLLGTIVILLVGSILLSGIWNGLAQSRLQVAFTQQTAATRAVESFLDGSSYDSPDQVAQTLRDALDVSQGLVGANGGTAVLIRARTSNAAVGSYAGGSAGRVAVGDLPGDLRDAVNRTSRLQGRRFSLLQEAGTRVPAVAVGSLITVPGGAGRYELYTVYRLDGELNILYLVQRTFVIGGLALVFLVGAVAYVVTRQVVTPVRRAAQIAEELASGALDRRMRVRGEDDLARLGRAFNKMAAGLERQIGQLEELSRVQQRFVSDVSHELRTPLTTIRMASEVLYEDREQFDPATARSAELLQNQLDRFEALLVDLLEISRFDAGAAVLDVDTADLVEVVARVCDGLSPMADSKGSPLQEAFPSGPAKAAMDVRRVERIVRNLVANAIEHGEGRPIQVSVACGEGAVAVSVRDHGIGLRPGEQQMVFNRFWRADPARARTMGGTGLGLSIALEDAHLHGGWLQVWGSPGVGTNFRLTLPVEAGVPLAGSPLPLIPALVEQTDLFSSSEEGLEPGVAHESA